jgi:membrane protein
MLKSRGKINNLRYLCRVKKIIHIFSATLQHFFEHKVAVRAAALTYYTTMALVPIVALVFAVAKSIGLSGQLDRVLEETFPEQDELVAQITIFAENTLRSVQGGWLESFGVLFLLWSVIKVMNYVERSFNDMWQVKHARSWMRKATAYFAVLLLAPVIFIVSVSLSLTLRYNVNLWFADIPVLEHMGYVLGTLLPFVLVYVMLTILYIVIPGTKVRFRSALWGALLAGTMFQLMQNLYFYTQISVSRYSAIYGAFAALPLLFMWINFSWTIVMLGAELSYTCQNARKL